MRSLEVKKLERGIDRLQREEAERDNRVRLPSITNHQLAPSAAEGSQTRPERSRRITAFLIDTLPIRIASNSFNCSAGAHSNRHSSEALKVATN